VNEAGLYQSLACFPDCTGQNKKAGLYAAIADEVMPQQNLLRVWISIAWEA